MTGLSEKDRAIIAATLPGNTSLTHFTDFRSSHEDLARLLSAVREEAYKEGWNDREGDLIAGVNRIMPEEASQGAGEPAKGWLYHCPDTGTEWSDNHPLESGEVSDAEDVRPATLDALHAELMAAWEVLAERISPPNPQAGEPVAGYCKPCGTMRAAGPCHKCGAELKPPHPDWEEPPVPDVAPIRALAREVGYAIGEHGSKERDLDLIAAPWTADAVSPQAMADHIAKGINGHVLATEQKPAGRWSCNIQIDGWFKLIDLSVSPPNPQARIEALEGALREAQSVLAMMVEPGAIQQTTVINAYAAAKSAEAKARAALNQGADHD